MMENVAFKHQKGLKSMGIITSLTPLTFHGLIPAYYVSLRVIDNGSSDEHVIDHHVDEEKVVDACVSPRVVRRVRTVITQNRLKT